MNWPRISKEEHAQHLQTAHRLIEQGENPKAVACALDLNLRDVYRLLREAGCVQVWLTKDEMKGVKMLRKLSP